MFNIGDKIVYPMYGAGTIEDVTEKEIDGEICTYYVMKIPVGNLTIMISARNAEKLGLRKISPSKDVLGIIEHVDTIDMADNWNERYKQNIERIKTGSLEKVLQVFKTLIFRERKKSLSGAEKKLLGKAKQIILSEIILSQDIDKDKAEEILEKTILVK